MTPTQTLLHEQHKERLARMGGNIPVRRPAPVKADSASEIAELAGKLEAAQATIFRLEEKVGRLLEIFGRMEAGVPVGSDTDQPVFSDIMVAICELYGITQIDLKSARRTENLIVPRQMACLLGRQLTGMSYPQIGHRLGNRDHTTTLHAATTLEKKLTTNELLRQDVETLKARIHARVLERQLARAA